MPKQYSHAELLAMESQTIGHYDNNAESFWQGTREHDVRQNIEAFLQPLPSNKALDILDFGCGPGRDLTTFKALGHNPVGLDGSKNFCQMAAQQSGCPVLHQDFLKLELEANSFDGIFANASLFHIPAQELGKVLGILFSALRNNGVLFSSNPRGNSEELRDDRYCHFMELNDMQAALEQAGFQILHHYYRPQGLPRDQQRWLAIVSQSSW